MTRPAMFYFSLHARLTDGSIYDSGDVSLIQECIKCRGLLCSASLFMHSSPMDQFTIQAMLA